MNTITKAESTYQRSEVFDNIVKHAKFGIALTAACTYGVEKSWRLPAVAGNVADEMEALIDSPLNKALSIMSVLSFAVTASTFFDPLFRKETTIFGNKSNEDSHTIRSIGGGIYLGIASVAVIWVYYKNKNKISAFKRTWQLPISVVSSGFLFFYGCYQLHALLKNGDDYKDRKLFMISSVIVNLSAPVEIYGVDRKLYEAEKRGLVYAAVYGARVVAKATQAIGLIEAKD